MAMSKEAKTQVKVSVAIETLWTAMSKNFMSILPKIAPNIVKSIDLIQGNGGLDSLFLFQFGPDVNLVARYQKEKLVILDESEHEIGLQVVEGGYLNQGVSSYMTVFKLTSIAEAETLVDVRVVPQTDGEESDHMPEDTMNTPVIFVKHFEGYLLKHDPKFIF